MAYKHFPPPQVVFPDGRPLFSNEVSYKIRGLVAAANELRTTAASLPAQNDPLPLVIASAAAVAVTSTKPVSRRSFFGLKLW